jgi:hypothetical protein
MKHLGAAIVVVAIAFGVSALAQPEEGAAKARPQMATVTGKLTKIDGKALTIAPAADPQAKDAKEAKEVVVTCDDSTRIFKMIATDEVAPAGEKAKEAPRGRRVPAKHEDLKVGQSVRASYNEKTGVVRGITITTVEAAAGSPASTAPAK